MIFKNAFIIDEQFNKVKADLEIQGETITAIGNLNGKDEIDCSDLTVMPGMIDLHIHGSRLADCSSDNVRDIQTVSRSLAENGITSFCPTTMTLSEDALKGAFSAIRSCMGREEGAYIHGINMEGPYLSHEKKGAQADEHIRTPDINEFRRLREICPICLVDVAPEVPGADAFAREASNDCTVSAAHTAASYEQTVEAFANGFSHATHLFNAMTPIQHRAPGVPSAVFDSESVTAELICDGFHIHPAVLRMAFRLLGKDRAVVVSDSMPAAQVGDGTYQLGGQTVYVKSGKATLADGTIAASTTNLFEEYKNLLRFGVDPQQAIRACTINPARVIGQDRVTGSLAVGKRADILITDDSLRLKAVFIKGKQIR
ncbi:MAG TPA: N-acetylglucosamine-6-phosphate deacetylase [Ruminococcaceae bacterium]|nr:N-acetylglucosamine-6-phosphate deacetylase [Oscillospiraceae bacterium]